MGFETYRLGLIRHFFQVRNLPMGFETYAAHDKVGEIPVRNLPMGFETSARRRIPQTRQFETSLWDLKLRAKPLGFYALPVRNLPMGFETLRLFQHEAFLYYVRNLPMGFETIADSYTAGSKSVRNLPMGFETHRGGRRRSGRGCSKPPYGI